MKFADFGWAEKRPLLRFTLTVQRLETPRTHEGPRRVLEQRQ